MTTDTDLIAKQDELILKLQSLLELVEHNLNRGMSKSIQRLQAQAIKEVLADLNNG